MIDYHRRTTCRGCGHGNLTEVMDLGEMPPANAFIRQEDIPAERAYPLTLAFCENCSLVQVPDVIDPAILFRDYAYATGASAPLVEHFRRYAEESVLPLVSRNDLVVDIGGNDCTLLAFLHDHCYVLNIDPAAPPNERIPIIPRMFSSVVARSIAEQFELAKVVTVNNVLAHVDDVHDFLRGVRHLLSDDGTFIFEVHWVKDLVDRTGYDQIYHEHLCYFSLHALDLLLEQADLELVDAKVVPMHGQCLRVKAIKARPESIHGMSEGCYDIINAEALAGLDTATPYHAFATRAQAHREILRDLIYDLVDGGARIIGYGAPAKGSTLLNYCGIGEDLEYVVDGSSAKQGRHVPGVHVPILSPDELRDDAPNYALLLSWNYANHILEKEKDLRARGTKFIVPFPEIRIV